MSNDQDTSRNTKIALALVLLFFGSIAAYYLLRPRQATATALFSVSSEPIRVLKDDEPFDPREFEILKRTQQAYLKSYFVAQAALRAPGMEALPVLAPHNDKVQWLIDNVDAKFMDNSEILSVSLTGPADQAEDLRQLVDALSDAYLKEAVFAEQQRRLVVLDAKRHAVASLADELRKVGRELYALEADSPDDKAQRDILQSEYDTLRELYRHLHRQIELQDAEAAAPNRIRRIQTSTVEIN